MKHMHLWGVAVAVTLLVVLTASPVLAEAFMEGYVGFSYPERTRVQVRSNAFVDRDASFGTSFAYGVRAGYWLSRVPWLGFAGDLSSVHAKGEKVAVDLTPLSLLVMLRAPLLASEEIPQGEIQPYVGIGPSFSQYTYIYANFEPAARSVSDWTMMDRGFIVPAGVTVQVNKHLAVFTEYRYTYYDIHYEEALHIGPNPDKFDANLASHNLLYGLSWHF